MKKIVIMAAGALMLLGSCSGGGKPNANLKTDVDSLSYEVGYLNSRGVKEYISQQLGVDTAYIDEFIKGVKAGAQSGEDKKKAAYNAGIQIGQQISTQMFKGINYEIYGEDSTKHVSLKNMVAGFIAGVRGKAVMDYKTAFNEANRLSNTLKETTYGKNGLRAYLQRRNAVALNKVNKLKADREAHATTNTKLMAQQDAIYRQELIKIKGEKGVPNVIIKATDDALYENLIDVLDEMQICGIGKYVIDKITDFDKKMIKYYTDNHPGSAAPAPAPAK